MGSSCGGGRGSQGRWRKPLGISVHGKGLEGGGLERRSGGAGVRCVTEGIRLGFPPDADGNGNYAFFDAANYALIQMTGGVTAISAV